MSTATATPVAPATIPEVKAPTPEQVANKKAFLDRLTGTTAEQAEKTVKSVKEFEGSHMDRATRMPQTTAQKEATAAAEAAAKAPAEAKEPAAEKIDPETPPAEPKATETKPKRPRRTVAEDDDRIASVAATAAARAVQAVLPKPEPKPEPAAKYEDTLPKSEKRKLETLQELERLYPDKKGVAQAFVEGNKAYDEYVRTWEKENPGQKFDESADEHNGFFEAQESKLNYNEDEFDEANESRIARKAREQVQSENSAKETERDRKIRMIEEKENLAETAAHAGAKMLELLEIPKLDDVPEVDREVYEKGVSIAKSFAKTAYSVMTGLVTDDPQNPIHQEVGAISVLLIRELGAMPPEETKNAEGQLYAQPWLYDAMTPQQKAAYWTLSPIDVIEYKTKHLSDQVRAHVEKVNTDFNTRAKARGFNVETPVKKTEKAPSNPTPSSPASPRKGGGPSVGSDVVSVAPKNSTNETPKKGLPFLASLWAGK